MIPCVAFLGIDRRNRFAVRGNKRASSCFGLQISDFNGAGAAGDLENRDANGTENHIFMIPNGLGLQPRLPLRPRLRPSQFGRR